MRLAAIVVPMYHLMRLMLNYLWYAPRIFMLMKLESKKPFRGPIITTFESISISFNSFFTEEYIKCMLNKQDSVARSTGSVHGL